MNQALTVHTRLKRKAFELDVAFDVSPGQTLALVGPSGAGKSTCLSAIAGLLALESGHVRLGDEVWCDTTLAIDWPPHRRRTGFVHQEYALFSHLNVTENVAYGACARLPSRAASRSMAHTWIERLGISECADRPVHSLSGGQRQRVALARALASGARVLLLDEPFGALDSATRNAVRQQLREFLREVQLPVVMVTHDPFDALTLANRVAIVEGGRISQAGTCEELLARPRTPFVAEIFGLNFYRAQLSRGEGPQTALVGSTIFHVPTTDFVGWASLAFPPSAVSLSADKPTGSAQNTFQAIVLEVFPLIDRMRVLLDCGVTMATEVVRESEVNLNLSRGRKVWASVKATAIQVYVS